VSGPALRENAIGEKGQSRNVDKGAIEMKGGKNKQDKNKRTATGLFFREQELREGSINEALETVEGARKRKATKGW